MNCNKNYLSYFKYIYKNYIVNIDHLKSNDKERKTFFSYFSSSFILKK